MIEYNDMTSDQRMAVNKLHGHYQGGGHCVFLTGDAGTGKSAIVDYLCSSGVIGRVLLTASTGIAAEHIGGVTLHSLFGIPHKFLRYGSANDEMRPEKRRILNTADSIIIDEVSMVRADVLDYIDNTLRAVCGCWAPFGGKLMVFVGDLHQLPPVVRGDEKRLMDDAYGLDRCYFFDARVMSEVGMDMVSLKEIVRQKDAHDAAVLNHIRQGRVTDSDLRELQGLYSSGLDGEKKYIHLCETNALARAINEANKQRVELLSQAAVEGDFNFSESLVEQTLPLWCGARVMCIRNNRDEGYVNGSTGYVEELIDDFVMVMLDDGRRVRVEKEEFEQNRYVVEEDDEDEEDEGKTRAKGKKKPQVRLVPKGKAKQFPLKLAYAITIHKSQGMTLGKVAVHFNSMFAPGMMYVALSRARSLKDVRTGKLIKRCHIKTDPAVVEFENRYKDLSV